MPRRRTLQDTPKIQSTDLIEYAIYARKSTEDDEKQKESIPQQLEQCFKFVESSGLLLKPRPAGFPPEEDKNHWEKEREKFESRERELLKEEAELSNEVRDEILEHTAFFELLSALPRLWKRVDCFNDLVAGGGFEPPTYGL